MNTNHRNLPNLSSIPGLAFRRFRGESDYPNILAVINASKEADQIEEADTLESIGNTYQHLTNCDPSTDVIIAEANGQVVAYSRLFWRKLIQGGRVYVHFGHVLPAWRHKGIGRTMLRHNERRLREMAAGHPDDGPKHLESFARKTETDRINLLECEGYQPVRYFYDMVRPDLENIPDWPLPPGLEIRPVKPGHVRTIMKAADEAFSDSWGEEEYTEVDFQRFLGSHEYAPDIWKVAWDVEANEVAGIVLGYIIEEQNIKFNRKRGWTENIAVRRQYRRRGLARALIAENLRELKARGMTEAALGVDTENVSGALRVYESLGFQPMGLEILYRKAMDLP